MRKAIVVVSFGVGSLQVKASCLDALFADVLNTFGTDFDVYEAWTSGFLRKKLAKEGCFIPSLEEILVDLAKNTKGEYEEVIVMPTHLTAGEEYQNKILPTAGKFKAEFEKVSVMPPIFAVTASGDFAFLAADDVLGLSELVADEEMVLMGHGSPHQHNAAYELLQQCADKLGWRVHIGVVEKEDFPNRDDVLRRLKDRGVQKIYLRPLLLAGGTHATQDLAGDEPDSWKSVLIKAGLQVRYSVRGMGESPTFRQLYINKLNEMINSE